MQDTPRKQVGRPTKFNQTLADVICQRLAEGQSLRQICRDETMPARTSVWAWLRKDREFMNHYARAREDQAESLFDEAIDIAREHEDPAKARVLIDTLKWAAGKLKPKKFGDKIEHTVQQDFIPLDELRRRIEESESRRGEARHDEGWADDHHRK
jgi:hypothetical protein